jgi:hypothetical protein
MADVGQPIGSSDFRQNIEILGQQIGNGDAQGDSPLIQGNGLDVDPSQFFADPNVIHRTLRWFVQVRAEVAIDEKNGLDDVVVKAKRAGFERDRKK